MVHRVCDAETVAFARDLTAAVGEAFPLLGFSDVGAAAFLAEYDPVPDYITPYRIETPYGDAFAATHGANLHFVIPSDWGARYAILREAIRAMVGVHMPRFGFVKIEIDERFPSHNAYYAGMLSELGFRLTPVAHFTAPSDLPERLAASRLPTGLTEARYSDDRYEEFVAAFPRISVFVEEFGGASEAREVEHREREQRKRRDGYHAYLWEMGRDVRHNAWIGVADETGIVGFCFGAVSGAWLQIGEIAVAESWRRRGVGRYLMGRCAEELRRHSGRNDGRFLVSTGRGNVVANRFYRGLGFDLTYPQTWAIATR